MNTAARMESTGIPNCIQVSQETSDLLKKDGRDSWLRSRDTKVQAKGKGDLQTYLLNINGVENMSRSGHSRGDQSKSENSDTDFDPILPMVDPMELEAKRNRVAEWTVEVMAGVIKTLVAARRNHGIKTEPKSKIEALEHSYLQQQSSSRTVIDEVAECIVLPDYHAKTSSREIEDPGNVVLDPEVVEELRNYVQTIASLYNDNPFHNFDHANHVVMSVNKLLSRIVAPDLDNSTAKNLHDYTFGITSDPLVWFAVVFAALIHDVDHTGLPNAVLVKEERPVASLYKNQSVAEQNSFDMAWDLLMEPAYANLRATLYTTTDELRRFRQLVVNSVLATDIVDKDMKTLRNNRWDAAFDSKNDDGQRSKLLKATIVIEHLIQASDVAHTMQHWVSEILQFHHFCCAKDSSLI